MSWLNTCAEGVTLRLRVIPRASRTRVDGTHGDALKIRLQAPPVDGKANKALVDFLAGQLHVPKSAVSLIQGETSRDKVVQIQGISAERVRTLASS